MTILVIVESPAKCKKIQSYLGSTYIVHASYGHICNLDTTKGIKAIDVNNNFTPHYANSKDKYKIIKHLQALSKKCSEVIIASDLDREGEAIGYHLVRILGLDIHTTKRIIFNEISKKAILKAVKEYTYLDIHKIHAQQARQIIDYLIGFSISPLLWKYVMNKSSAGRCQSATLLLLYNKYNTFNDYKEAYNYNLKGSFKHIDDCSSSFHTKEKKNIITFFEESKVATFTIKSVKKTEHFVKPPKPFITSTIQQEASNKLKYSPKRTMMILQRLYEGGYITYMRTDSFILSKDSMDTIKHKVKESYGDTYHQTRKYTNKNTNCQEAHECIRPVDCSRNTLQDVEHLGDEYKKMYELIWKRTVASQMSDNKKEKCKITIQNDKNTILFTKTLEKDLFLGFRIVYNEEKTDTITPIEKWLQVNKMVHKQMFTSEQTYKSSIQMYSEATLIRDLEKKGIGRPSTYSNILDTLYKRKYIVKKNHKGIAKNIDILTLSKHNKIHTKTKKTNINKQQNKLFISDIGIKVIDFMKNNFNDIINESYTATLENSLDKIYNGEGEWLSIIRSNYEMYSSKIKSLRNKIINKDKKMIGILEDTNQKVFVYIGKYGKVAQVGEDNVKYYTIPDDMELVDVTIDEVKKMIDKKKENEKQIIKVLTPKISIRNGPYGPYIMNKLKKVQFIPIPKEKQKDLQSLTLKECKEIIKNYVPKKKVYKKYTKK
jgi:DNA topoisomerase-1